MLFSFGFCDLYPFLIVCSQAVTVSFMGSFISAHALNGSFCRILFFGFFSSHYLFFQLGNLPFMFVVPSAFHEPILPQCISGVQLFVWAPGLKLQLSTEFNWLSSNSTLWYPLKSMQPTIFSYFGTTFTCANFQSKTISLVSLRFILFLNLSIIHKIQKKVQTLILSLEIL